MTALSRAATAYSTPQMPLRSPRMVEYDLLARATQMLTAAAARRATDFPGLVRALAENQRLWLTLATDVADPGNALPAPLRSSLFYLYEFTEHHSRAVRDSGASVDVLIDINTAVMRGLRGQGGAA